MGARNIQIATTALIAGHATCVHFPVAPYLRPNFPLAENNRPIFQSEVEEGTNR
jgi:hypothetical protein